MRVQVNFDFSIETSDALTHTVDTAIHKALDRYGDRTPRAEVYLSADRDSDCNDPEGSRCQLEVQPAGMELVVTGTADTAERACHDTARKMQRLLESTFNRANRMRYPLDWRAVRPSCPNRSKHPTAFMPAKRLLCRIRLR